jgi:hypothetical protein
MVRGVLDTVCAARRDAVDRWGGMARAERMTTMLLAFMIVGGTILRM